MRDWRWKAKKKFRRAESESSARGAPGAKFWKVIAPCRGVDTGYSASKNISENKICICCASLTHLLILKNRDLMKSQVGVLFQCPTNVRSFFIFLRGLIYIVFSHFTSIHLSSIENTQLKVKKYIEALPSLYFLCLLNPPLKNVWDLWTGSILKVWTHLRLCH